MFILYFDCQFHEYYHGVFERNGWRDYADWRCHEGYWLVPGTDPEDGAYFLDYQSQEDDEVERDENDETLEYMVELLDAHEIEPDEFRRQLLSVGYAPETISAAIAQVAA